MTRAGWKGVIAILAGITFAAAIGVWLLPAGRWVILAAGTAAACALIAIALLRRTPARSPSEPDHIEQLDHARWSELVRGTSMHLREMRYRYSVRADRTDAGSRRAFTAEVNTIRLGFLPVILTDNTTDYQGYGYLAFVYDGHRWRGPGLPCPDGREQAMAHARQNVSPADSRT